ncbi:MAG: divergent PAP2 family protein [Candidatus Eiseniibacteriota bacterium]
MKAFEIALLTSIAVQLYKGFTAWAWERRLNFRRFVETGGMPSSHSAAVAALSTTVGIEEGVVTSLFGVTVFFSLIVMYDAAGLRRAAGRQATLLNQIVAEHENRALREKKLFELLGHTPLEVLVGALIGVGSALLLNRAL